MFFKGDGRRAGRVVVGVGAGEQRGGVRAVRGGTADGGPAGRGGAGGGGGGGRVGWGGGGGGWAGGRVGVRVGRRVEFMPAGGPRTPYYAAKRRSIDAPRTRGPAAAGPLVLAETVVTKRSHRSE